MLFYNLRQAIDAQRAQPAPPVEIQPFSPEYFDIAATLFVHQDDWSRRKEIEKAARASLTAAFGFEQRDFGQVITTAELIAVLHAADAAITGVQVTDLRRTDDRGAKGAADQLRPRETRELLMINAEGEAGIVLTLRLEEAV